MDRRKFLELSGWSLAGLAATGSLSACASKDGECLPLGLRHDMPSLKDLKVYWGDLHNHCNVTYGHGDIDDALAAAEQQLDFASVTPHAMWPDIPGEGDPRLEWVIGYHTDAFKRLRAGGYDKYLAKVKDANKPGKFLTFPSYECHSMIYGDHVAVFADYNAPLVEATSVPDLKEKLKGYRAYVTPHHMGYITGYRGINWDEFHGDSQTPFVEIFSRHGCAENDTVEYQYMHDMGPRIWEGTALCGLEKGHKFGMMCSTDQHAGYPGSYGDGRIGVYASALDRDEIFSEMGKRHICGITGDKIKMDFRINKAQMGDEISARKREVYVNVEAQNFIDYIEVVKNGESLAKMSAPASVKAPEGAVVRAKVKINFGWNREETYIHWKDAKISLTGGQINDMQTCFRGAAFTSPQPGETEFKTRVNRVVSKSDSEVVLDLYSCKNPNVLTPAMQGVILDVTMPRGAKVVVEANGHRYEHSLEELLGGAQAHFLRGWLSEAIQFERAVPESAFCAGIVFTDDKQERDTDYYYLRVRQRDGQWAWSSPIWVNRK